ncbi:sugar phosphate nucleotidyltransferase [Halalkaliarchaeum sp. AArc-GB]|uniref:sugar phosphate nucleotidyltransferase n=1 Tax=Halalkaliarchaeum sp. AArc-GB TaxID=3074078 RepID=UPI00285DA5F4|nr:sugar phosphate nucleotidyltransferase [Halalkaliarchaeum sp. AArc-GB]MDR5674624.1 sugar phosphate nucleotidyltransferase [Halalkaliarchaeum sp. AArc-GB]
MTRDGISRAVVLAAGEGSRLRPLTRYQPKPMLRVGGRPIIEYPLDALVEAGIERATVVVGHGNTRIQNRFKNSYRGMELSYARQDTQLGSGHALQMAREQATGAFVVVNGDTVIDDRMVTATIERYDGDAAGCLAVATSETPADYGTVEVRDGFVEHVDEHRGGESRCQEGTSRINAGVYVFDETVFEALAEAPSVNGEFPITGAVDRLDRGVLAVTPNGVWFDPSYFWDLLATNEAVLSTHQELLGPIEPVAPTARIHDTAVVEEHVRIGPDCRVSAGAIVRDGTTLQANTTVGENTVLEGSIVGPDTHVGASVVLRDTVVGSGARIGDGAVSTGGLASLVVNGREYTNRRLGGVVADRANVGGNVTIEPGCRIGTLGTVGPGVTLREDVPEGATVIG